MREHLASQGRPRLRTGMNERYVVLPRGINVGRGNRVPMAQLRSMLESEGYADVATVLQSGNIILTTRSKSPRDVAGAMERLLGEGFDVNVRCMVRTAYQVRAVLERNPLREVVTNPSRYLVNFLSEDPQPEQVAEVLGEDHTPEAIAIEGAEAYIWSPDGVARMTLSYRYLEKRLGVVATARNWNTVEKIAAKL